MAVGLPQPWGVLSRGVRHVVEFVSAVEHMVAAGAAGLAGRTAASAAGRGQLAIVLAYFLAYCFSIDSVDGLVFGHSVLLQRLVVNVDVLQDACAWPALMLGKPW